jgi:hypothetical protein
MSVSGLCILLGTGGSKNKDSTYKLSFETLFLGYQKTTLTWAVMKAIQKITSHVLLTKQAMRKINVVIYKKYVHT